MTTRPTPTSPRGTRFLPRTLPRGTRMSRHPLRLASLLALTATLLLSAACSEVRDAISSDDSPTSEVTATATTDPTPLAAHYIGNTGGLGVSLRSDCTIEARLANAWPESTQVQLLQLGEGRCEGWSLAEVNGVTSWVSQHYLTSDAPAAPTLLASAPAPTPAATDAPTTPSPSPTPHPQVTATATSTSAAAPLPPVTLYGPAAQHDTILILIDGQPCITVNAAPEPATPTGYLWYTQLPLGQCDAHTGSLITFTLNGLPTNEQLEWTAGGTPPNATTGLTLTLR
jgi:hypothetical protein